MAAWGKQARFVIWLVTLVLPPAVVGGLEQRFIAHYPVWAVMVVVAYAAMAAVVGFLASIHRSLFGFIGVSAGQGPDWHC
jgi:hypothetical protein